MSTTNTSSTTHSPVAFVELILSCGSWQEAQRIVDRLLEQKLIASAEYIPVKAREIWKQELKEGTEVKLIMESAAHYVGKVEAEVARLWGERAFSLQAVPIENLSQATSGWLHGELKLTD